ncbi:MAG: endonuclease/exonuclease/phosphatase family protein [Gammaproteobacteria bacterium]|nr:endonuclease/exonuclease/phosphatase family protein [Gammaproteobacteria bacterium]
MYLLSLFRYRLFRYSLLLLVLFIFLVLMLLIQPLQRLQTSQGLSPDSHSAANSVIIAIWNLHNQQSWHKSDNNAVIAQQFASTSLGKSDLLALQEVELFTEMRAIAAANKLQFHGARDAILARLKLVSSGHLTLNPKGKTAFWADIELKNGIVLRLYSVHLSYKKGRSPFIAEIRGQETKALTDHAENFNGPVIIAGDFNTLSLFSPDFSQIPVFTQLKQAGFKSTRPLGACNSQIPLGEQDWIFIKNARTLRYVCGNYAGSDHRWIQAEIIPQ